MADKYGRPESLAEMVAQYTGAPLEEVEATHLTEEEQKALHENMQKLKNLSREERLKWRREAAERMREKGIY